MVLNSCFLYGGEGHVLVLGSLPWPPPSTGSVWNRLLPGLHTDELVSPGAQSFIVLALPLLTPSA